MASIGRFLKTGMPLVKRRFTVSGDAIARPCNANIIIGTRLRDVMEFAGLTKEPHKVVLGGPMMATPRSIWTTRHPPEQRRARVQQRRHGTARHHRMHPLRSLHELVSHAAVAHRYQEGVHGPGREEARRPHGGSVHGLRHLLVRLSSQTAARPDKQTCARLHARRDGKEGLDGTYDETTACPLDAAARVRRHHHAEGHAERGDSARAHADRLVRDIRLAGAAGYRRDTAACVLFEYLWCLLRKTPQTAGDLSAVVTGLLLAFNLPSPSAVHGVIGSFVASSW